MRLIKNFSEFIEEGIVTKISPNKQRAENLDTEAKRKFTLLKNNIKKLGVNEDNANDYVEYCYNIIIFRIRAKMLIEGYSSSGQGSHEAEVSYGRNLNFSENELQLLNQLRYFRNGILYYGKQFDKEYVEKLLISLKKFIIN